MMWSDYAHFIGALQLANIVEHYGTRNTAIPKSLDTLPITTNHFPTIICALITKLAK